MDTDTDIKIYKVNPVINVREIILNFLALLTLTHTTLAEFWSSTMFLSMGMLFLLPGVTLIESVPFYVRMTVLMTEGQWGVLFLVIGFWQQVANLMRWSVLRKTGAFVASFVLGVLTFLALATKPIPLAAAIFASASLVQGLVYVSLSLARWRLMLTGHHAGS